jgi:hypothetical protein
LPLLAVAVCADHAPGPSPWQTTKAGG